MGIEKLVVDRSLKIQVVFKIKNTRSCMSHEVVGIDRRMRESFVRIIRKVHFGLDIRKFKSL
jgi:hypothetical protein